MDSPLAIEENVNPVVSQTEPPNRQKAAPKLTRVRVLASKNKLPSTAPSSTRDTFCRRAMGCMISRSEEHTSELQSRGHLVCRLLLEKKKLNNLGVERYRIV